MRNAELEPRENPYRSPEEAECGAGAARGEMDPRCAAFLRKGLGWFYGSTLVGFLALAACVFEKLFIGESFVLAVGWPVVVLICFMQAAGTLNCLRGSWRLIPEGPFWVLGSWLLFPLLVPVSVVHPTFEAVVAAAVGVWLWHGYLIRLALRLRSGACVTGVAVMMLAWLVMILAWVRFWQLDEMLKSPDPHAWELTEVMYVGWTLAASCGVMLVVYMAVLLRLRYLAWSVQGEKTEIPGE